MSEDKPYILGKTNSTSIPAYKYNDHSLFWDMADDDISKPAKPQRNNDGCVYHHEDLME